MKKTASKAKGATKRTKRSAGSQQRRVRRFTHVHAFGDGTRWVEPGVVVDQAYKRNKCKWYSLAKCLEKVREGVWKEIV